VELLIFDDDSLSRRAIYLTLRRFAGVEIVGECGDGASEAERILACSLVMLVVLSPFGAEAAQVSGSLTSSSVELAKQIRDDQNLRQVRQMALDLLNGGLNAGTHYPQVWIRDLNTFIIVALEGNPPAALRDALLTLFKFQGPEGDIPDGYLPLNPNQKGKPYRVTPLAPGLQGKQKYCRGGPGDFAGAGGIQICSRYQ
jgi:hypothetical protein